MGADVDTSRPRCYISGQFRGRGCEPGRVYVWLLLLELVRVVLTAAPHQEPPLDNRGDMLASWNFINGDMTELRPQQDNNFRIPYPIVDPKSQSIPGVREWGRNQPHAAVYPFGLLRGICTLFGVRLLDSASAVFFGLVVLRAGRSITQIS